MDWGEGDGLWIWEWVWSGGKRREGKVGRTVSATQTVWRRSFRRAAISATKGRIEGGGKGEEEGVVIITMGLRVEGESLVASVDFVHDFRAARMVIGHRK